MVMQRKIQRRALDKVTEIFNKDIHNRTIRRTVEEINQLAQSEADLFYQSGKFLFFPVSYLGNKDVVNSVYTQTFINTYTKFKNHYQSAHPSEFLSQ